MKNLNSNNTKIAILALLNILLIYNVLSTIILLVAFGAFLLVFLAVDVDKISDKA